ncbi:MAG: hypothetical protein ACE5GB_15710 [Acidimicrobiales bacterium]
MPSIRWSTTQHLTGPTTRPLAMRRRQDRVAGGTYVALGFATAVVGGTRSSA